MIITPRVKRTERYIERETIRENIEAKKRKEGGYSGKRRRSER